MCSRPQALHFSAVVKCQGSVVWCCDTGPTRTGLWVKRGQTFISAAFFSSFSLAEGSEGKAKNRCARVCMFAWVRAEVLRCVCAVSSQCGNMMLSGTAPHESEKPAWAQHSARMVSTESRRQACSSAQQQHLPGQINLVEPHVCLPCSS